MTTNPEIGEIGGLTDDFPIGMRVLIVDDDPLCLTILKKMLQQCKYHVTACSRAIEALQLLREKKSKFDIVMSDVYMPDIDGFKLLELIGLEMDLPVIMMSANGETSVVMKGITHGACDYLLKPVRIEELRNIWQHVIRKQRGGTKEAGKEESSGEWDESEKFPEYSSKKRKEKFDSSEDQIDDISGLKKARVVWSGDLHRLFVKAVNQLGVEKAVPKRILEIMNVQGLTRENVASHLQKYRMGLKRLSGVDMEPHPIASFQADESGSYGGAMCIRPGGMRSPGGSNTRSCSTSSGVFGKGVNQLDPGTLAALKQLQALQQQGPGGGAQLLKGPRALRMRQTAFDGNSAAAGGSSTLQRTASIELGSLKMQDEWSSAAWKQQGVQSSVIKEERICTTDLSSPGGASGSTTVEDLDSAGVAMSEAFELSKITEDCVGAVGRTAETTVIGLLAPQETNEFCLEGTDYFAASPGFSISQVFHNQQQQQQQQQQQKWSTDY